MDTITWASMQFHANACEPFVHTTHDDGTYSVRLTPQHDAFAVYVMGTPQELFDLATRLNKAALDAFEQHNASKAESVTS